MMGIENILFLILLVAAIGLFTKNVRKIARNIRLGQPVDRSDNPGLRASILTRVALGQSKLMFRPIPGLLHVIVYAGFIIVNIEVIEIMIDGITGTHRVLKFMGPFYNFLIASFEILALLVIVACVIFLVRRNIVKVRRFWAREITSWPRSDANIILITEILLMTAFLKMNAADAVLQTRGLEHYTSAGMFPVSSMLQPIFEGMSTSSLVIFERAAWWFHIIGILVFLNYLPYSKHFHIILSFPNVYYSNLNPKGKFTNLESVTNEVKLMLDPSATPSTDAPPTKFGAHDVKDLSWKQLMDAYSCTECGRCTSACPANQTGKLLSPRKIMMDTRDRLEEVGKNIDLHGPDHHDGKMLIGHGYITPEELWACTSCNACVQECPVNIDPLSIIVDLRRYLVMEQSAAPAALNAMFSNIENNGAPWQFSPSDRFNWSNES
jgi:heterodisulfide reductase subunit C